MFRGFRWQLLVLLTALALFTTSLLSRPAPAGVGVTTAAPTNSPVISTPTPVQPATEPFPAVTAAPPAEIITFREALVGSLQRLNPLLAGLNPVDQDITSLIFEGLVKINVYGEAEPGLAAEWVISSDRLEYIFRLREDILWQDGTRFSAVDVVYTVSLLQSPDFPGPPTLGRLWQTIEVQQLGDYLVRFRLTQPLGSFLDSLRIGILPEHALRGTTAAQIANHPFNLSPIGTGPYQLESLRTDDGTRVWQIDLRAAPVFRQRPEGQSGYTVERLSFHLFDTFDQAVSALQAGTVDGLAARSRYERPALLGIPGTNLHTAVEPTIGFIIFNWSKPETAFFREQRVRAALKTGLDRNSIIERYLSNLAIRADSPLIPGSWAYVSELDWPTPDSGAARQLIETANLRIDEAEVTPDPSGRFFSFTILTPDDPALVSVAQEVATQWSQLNQRVSIESADRAAYQTRLEAGDFDAALVELSLGESADPDVYAFWDSGQYPDGANYGGVNDRRISEDLERARSDPFGLNRIVHYGDFQRDFIERAIAIPLYYPLYTYVTNSRFSGIQIGTFVGSPASRFYTIRDWTFSP